MYADDAEEVMNTQCDRVHGLAHGGDLCRQQFHASRQSFVPFSKSLKPFVDRQRIPPPVRHYKGQTAADHSPALPLLCPPPMDEPKPPRLVLVECAALDEVV